MARIVVFVMRLPRCVTEGFTLRTASGSDKRTKEVFSLYLQRMNGRTGMGSQGTIEGLDNAP